MSEVHKDIDELLSCYVDGECSERERTKLKRLMQHDKSIADRLSRLRKQKQLLNNLPVASAPEGLLEDIKVSLKPKPILKRYLADSDESAGIRHLLFRRVLTAAAMFMLVGILVVVVFSVIMPDTGSRELVVMQPDDSSKDAGTTRETIVEPTAVEAVATTDSYPFKAALELASYDSVAVNGFIAKAIYSNALVDNTIPKREEALSTYHIACTTGQIVKLLGDLEVVWDKCDKTSLTIYAEDPDSSIMINNITSAQAIAVFAQDKPDERTELARNFADFNALIRDQFDGSDFALSTDEEKFFPSVPVKPELTRPEEPLRRNLPQTEGSVNLIITVTGL